MAIARTAPESRTLGRLTGPARADRRTKNLAARLRPGEIAVIDHADLDALAARSLVEARPLAVIDARPLISGKYPNRGPAVLLEARVPLYTLPEPELFTKIRDGQRLTIDAGHCLYIEDSPFCTLTRWDEAMVADATAAARANLGGELEKFARNTLQYLDADKDLLLDPTDVPVLPGLKFRGRHALVVVRGEGYKEDLQELKPYLRDTRPVLIAVDGAADALIAIGRTPDVIIGDMDSVSDGALRCGARLIVHAYARRSGEAPGMARVEALGLSAATFAVPGTSEDAALLLAYEHNADLIVTVGTHSNLEDFLDKGRAGMASTFLTRLKVGPRLVDARSVFKLYRPTPPVSLFLAVLLSALLPFVLLLRYSPLWYNLVTLLRVWLRLHTG